MENTLVVLNFLVLAAVVIVGLLLKHYLPPYLTEKGKNLATKEDIEEITNKIERVRSQYASEIEKLKSELQNQSEVLGRRDRLISLIAKIFTAGHTTFFTPSGRRIASRTNKGFRYRPTNVRSVKRTVVAMLAFVLCAGGWG